MIMSAITYTYTGYTPVLNADTAFKYTMGHVINIYIVVVFTARTVHDGMNTALLACLKLIVYTLCGEICI